MGIQPNDVTAESLLAQASWLNALARRLVGDSNVADDVVQDTFASALVHPPPADRVVRPWLARVARNAARMRARSESARATRERASSVAREALSAGELAEKLESQRLLVEAVRDLSEPYRSTILLHYWEHKTSEEIAALHGIAAATVRWRLKQGVDALRERLDARHGGDRRAWCAVLAPLVARDTHVAVASTSLFAGLLAMKLVVKAAIAAVVVIALGAGLLLVAEPMLGSSGAPELSQERVAVEFKPLAAPDRSAGGTALDVPERSARADAGAAPVERNEAAVRIEARVLDVAGRPIVGARIQCTSPVRGTLPTSDADGRIEGDVELKLESVTLGFQVRAFGHATRVLEAHAARGQTTYLGDVVLQPGGAVSGRVVDLEDRPVSGATIGVDPVDIPQSELIHRKASRHVGVPSTTSAPDGTFHLDGVAVGLVRVVGVSDEHEPSYSGIVEVRAGSESSGVVLELETIPSDRIVRGIVLDPDGSPVPDVQITFRATTSRFSSSGGNRSGDDGRFREIVIAGADVDVIAHDVHARWADAAALGAKPGDREIVLQFSAAKWMVVALSSSSGRAVEDFRGWTETADGEHRLSTIDAGKRETEKPRVLVPAVPFVIRIEAKGHLVKREGPFDPATAPSTIDVALEAVPGITGRVHARGAPIAGARVCLHRRVAQYTEKDGFPVLASPSAIDTVRTSEDGSYALTPRESGTYVVYADSEGLALAESAELEVDVRHGMRGVDLRLTEGGSIEGAVLVPPGRNPVGTIVAIARGDGFARTTRVGPEGTFRFEHLIAGRWLVKTHDKELNERTSSSGWKSGPVREIPWNCEVLEGRATRFDVDLRAAQAQCTVQGTLRVRGAELGKWTAMLRRADDVFSPGGNVVELDPSGAFALESSEPGKMTIVLTALDGPFDGLRVLADVDVVKGVTLRNVALDAARLSVDASKVDNPFGLLVYLATIDEQTFAMSLITTKGEPAEKLVPAGKGRIAAPPAENPSKNPREWPALVDVTLALGETKRVTVP
jgi:RNA polymerase sigma-70 factor (ECF subfamily)